MLTYLDMVNITAYLARKFRLAASCMEHLDSYLSTYACMWKSSCTVLNRSDGINLRLYVDLQALLPDSSGPSRP